MGLVRSSASKVTMFRCTQCFYQSNRKSNVSRHDRRIHGRVKKSIICPCGKSFHTKGEYYAHCEAKHPMHRICSKMSKEKYKISADTIFMKRSKKEYKFRRNDESRVKRAASKDIDESRMDEASEEEEVRKAIKRKRFMPTRCSMRIMKRKSRKSHIEEMESLPLADRLLLMQEGEQFFSSSEDESSDDEEYNEKMAEDSREANTDGEAADDSNAVENGQEVPESVSEPIVWDIADYNACQEFTLDNVDNGAHADNPEVQYTVIVFHSDDVAENVSETSHEINNVTLQNYDDSKSLAVGSESGNDDTHVTNNSDTSAEVSTSEYDSSLNEKKDVGSSGPKNESIYRLPPKKRILKLLGECAGLKTVARVEEREKHEPLFAVVNTTYPDIVGNCCNEAEASNSNKRKFTEILQENVAPAKVHIIENPDKFSRGVQELNTAMLNYWSEINFDLPRIRA